MRKFTVFFLFLFTRARFILGLSPLFSEGDECLLVKGEGICKSAFDCRWIRDEQIHENDWTHCNFGRSSHLICCADPEFTLHDTLDCHTDTQPIFSYGTMNKCLKRANASKASIKSTKLSFDTIFYTDEQCKALHDEHKRLEAIDYIEGVAHGEDAEPGEFPFMASLLTLQEDGSYLPTCGGSIITKRHIMTAAHCINNNKTTEYSKITKVRIGSIRLDEIYQEIEVSNAPVAYPAYVSTGGGYDIAILHLVEDIKISKDALPACLYHGKEPLVTESRATVIGFGKTHKTANPDVLQKAQINIKDGLFCAPGIIQKISFNGLKGEQICAADSNVTSDTCQGDSGAPLIQTLGNTEWKTVVGLTSFGPSFCDSNNRPGVYTRVSSFVQWIKGVVENDFAKKGVDRRVGRKRRFRLQRNNRI